MAWLGLLPIEIETSRWKAIPRPERIGQICCSCIGDTKHFLYECEGLTAEPVKSLESKATYAEARGQELFFWRGIVRIVDCRWWERTSALRKQQHELAHAADANDAEVCADVDAIIGQNLEPPAEELGNALLIAPQGKVAAKPRKKQQKPKSRDDGTSLD